MYANFQDNDTNVGLLSVFRKLECDRIEKRKRTGTLTIRVYIMKITFKKL